jgi:hypothetical protein
MASAARRAAIASGQMRSVLPEALVPMSCHKLVHLGQDVAGGADPDGHVGVGRDCRAAEAGGVGDVERGCCFHRWDASERKTASTGARELTGIDIMWECRILIRFQ